MLLVILGVLLLAAKMTDIGPTADWSWWIVLAPFGGAVAWWGFADSIGLTQRRAMDKMELRKQQRRDKAMVALGRPTSRDRAAAPAREHGRPAQRPEAPPEARRTDNAPDRGAGRDEPRL